MGVLFKGNGSAYIPVKHSFVHFVGGEYETADAAEIEVLAQYYEHDTKADAVENHVVHDEPVEIGRASCRERV